MMRTLFVSTLLLLCVFGATHVAAGDACNGDDFGTAGQFDFYVFALSWPAQFCQQHQDWPGCEQPTEWQSHNLTLHGLWPNFRSPQSGHSWPQCCPSRFGSNIDPNVFNSLESDLQLYWPNEQDPSGGDLQNSLWNHEWGKHGTCSGLDQRTYLTTAMQLLQNLGTPAVIGNNIGNNCQLSDLQAAFGGSGCTVGSDCIVGFNCANQNGQLYLSGVTTCWDKNFNQITCPAAVLGSQGRQCTASTVYIQSF